MVRQRRAIPPNAVHELIYNEARNEVVFIKYLNMVEAGAKD